MRLLYFSLMMPDNVCANCQQSFAANEQIVNADGHIWHTRCFVCAQCFQPFENGLYFEVRTYLSLIDIYFLYFNSMKVGNIVNEISKCYLHPVVLNAVRN